MHKLVESPPLDLPLDVWRPIYDLVVEFKPELILELGRGWGNSTCLLTQAANDIGADVVSVGFDSEHAWETRTAPRLLSAGMPPAWFATLRVFQADITDTDFAPIVDGRRTFVFWDAHGTDVADAVIGRLFPLLEDNLVLVDDVWQIDRAPSAVLAVAEEIVVGELGSIFEEVAPIWKYLAGNGIDWQAYGSQIKFQARVTRR